MNDNEIKKFENLIKDEFQIKEFINFDNVKIKTFKESLTIYFDMYSDSEKSIVKSYYPNKSKKVFFIPDYISKFENIKKDKIITDDIDSNDIYILYFEDRNIIIVNKELNSVKYDDAIKLFKSLKKMELKNKELDEKLLHFYTINEYYINEANEKNDMIKTDSFYTCQINELIEENNKNYDLIDKNRLLNNTDIMKKVYDEIEKIKKLEYILDVYIDKNGNVEVIFDDVYFNNIKRKEYLVKKPTLTIFSNVNDNRMYMTCDNSVKIANRLIVTPHISNGRICLGGGEDIAKYMINNLQLEKLVIFIYFFMRKYSRDNPFVSKAEYIREKKFVIEQDKTLDDFQSEKFIISEIE